MKTICIIASLSLLASASSRGALVLVSSGDSENRPASVTTIQNNLSGARSQDLLVQNSISGSQAGQGRVGSASSDGGTGSASTDQVAREVGQAIDVALDRANAAVQSAGQSAQDYGQKLHGWENQLFPNGDVRQNYFTLLDPNPTHSTPAVVVTRPMDSQTSSHLQEDLKVMDRLLRDDIVRVDDHFMHLAMGLNLLHPARYADPMYLEDFGAVFSFKAAFPLAGPKTSSPKKDQAENSENHSDSAWDRAKAELDAPSEGQTGGESAHETAVRAQMELIDSIIRLLPEAKNIRNLKETDWVLVTVAGNTDKGGPARLTIKAKKADIDQAASGQIKPEEFKERLAWTVD